MKKRSHGARVGASQIWARDVARARRGSDGGCRSRPGTSAGAGAYLALGFLEAAQEAEETLCV